MPMSPPAGAAEEALVVDGDRRVELAGLAEVA